MGANGWLRLELRYLAALEAIAATGSFGGAADRLGYTQSAVSQQIAALERLVGQPLIDPPGGPPPVRLTEADSPLLEGGEVPLETLGSLPLIGYRGCRIEERVVSYLRGLGIDVNRVAYARDNAIIQAMVAAGRGAALLTQLSIDESDPQTATLKLADWMPRRRVGLGWHPERASSPALEAFIATAREVTRPRRERIRSAAKARGRSRGAGTPHA